MEQLTQKYIKYFYVALIGIILAQSIGVIVKALTSGFECNVFVLTFLSIINLILLSSSLIYSIKQRFTESKTNAKVLRFTMALLILAQSMVCFRVSHDFIMLGNHLMNMVVLEIVLNYRIKSIEHLEHLANKFVNESELYQKGE